MERQTFAERVKSAMKKRKMTQEQLSKIMGKTIRTVQNKLYDNSFSISEVIHLTQLFNIKDD